MADTSPSYALLERPVYEIGEASRLLGVADSTLRWWLHGRDYRGRTYLPALRPDRNSDVTVRWGEFIEAAVLRFLRRDRNIPLRELRSFRVEVTSRYPDVQFPLATDQLFLKGGRLSLQELAGLWEPSTGTVFDEAAARDFFERCRWQDHIARSYGPRVEQPHVQVQPDLQFGAPQLRGVRTQSMFDLHAAGEPLHLIAEDLELDMSEVEEAIAFERAIRPNSRAS